MKKILALFLSLVLLLLPVTNSFTVLAVSSEEASATNDDLYAFAAALAQMLRTNDQKDSNISDEYLPVEDDGTAKGDDISDKFPITYSQTENTAEFLSGDIKVTATDGSNTLLVDNGEGEYTVQTKAESVIRNGEMYVSAEDVINAMEFDANDYSLIPRTFGSGRLIVKAEKEFDHRDALECVSGYNNLHVLQFKSIIEAYDAYTYYESCDDIIYCEPDIIRVMQSTDVDTHDISDIVGGTSEYLYQVRDKALSWVSASIGFEDIKDQLGKSVLDSVVVGVIDSGVDTDHELLAGRIEETNVNLSTTGEPNSCEDDYGHGTHVAGIIADNTLSNVKIRPYKVLNNQGKCSTIIISVAIDMAVADGVDVINLSLAAEGNNKVLQESVDAATESGINVVVAAGNDSKDLSENEVAPACIESAITVSSVNDEGYLSKYSNYNGTIDIAAPGEDVKSSYLNNTYRLLSGTSMAAPVVTAAVAIVHSVYPDKSGADVESMIKKYAIKVKEAEGDNRYGAGLVYLKYILDKLPRTAPVEFSVKGGMFSNTFKLTLKCSEANSTILYVLNPKSDNITIGYSNGTEYKEPLTISVDTKVAAVAIVRGKMFSTVVKNEYIRSSGSPEDLYDIDSSGFITGYVGTEVDLTVPETIRGVTVKGIASSTFKNNDRIHSVALPDTAERISSYAFYECGLLETVTGRGIVKVDSSAFQNSTISNFPFSQLEKIGSKAFAGCNNLHDVDLSNVRSIESAAFEYSSSIFEINGDSLQSVGKYAFRGTEVKKVSLPLVSVLNIGVFEGCSYLDTIEAPQVITLGEGALRNCISMRNINLPKVANLGKEAFLNTPVVKIEFPKVQTVGQRCFGGCSALQSVILESAKNVNGYAFVNCVSLELVYLPSATAINDYTFAGCKKLKAAWFESVTTVSSNAFVNSFIEYLQLDSVTKLANLPDNLKAVILSTTVSSIPATAPRTDFTVYGYQDSCAEEYALDNSKKFEVVPAVMCDIPEQVSVDEKYLLAYSFGFNCKYQWYKNDVESNENGTLIDGATNFWYEPSRADGAVAYYCVIESDDGIEKNVITTDAILNAPEYREADYTEYNECLDIVNELDRSLYTDDSLAVLDELVNTDISGYSLAEQSLIVEHIEKIKTAISNLVYKYVLGDINDDGTISIIDARIALTAVSGTTELTFLQTLAADVNGDGTVSIIDVRIILQVASDLITLS